MKDSVVIKKGEHVIIRKYTKLQFLNDSKVEKRFSNIWNNNFCFYLNLDNKILVNGIVKDLLSPEEYNNFGFLNRIFYGESALNRSELAHSSKNNDIIISPVIIFKTVTTNENKRIRSDYIDIRHVNLEKPCIIGSSTSGEMPGVNNMRFGMKNENDKLCETHAEIYFDNENFKVN